MTLEEKARQEIDRQLEQAGWSVQSQAEMNIFAGPRGDIREFKLTSGFADYLLYVDGKAGGVTGDESPDTPFSDEQLQAAEAQLMKSALKPFHNPKLRETIQRITDQIIDTQAPDQIVEIGYGEEAKERAQTLIRDFRQNVSGKALAAGEDNKDEIEAISIL